MKIKNSVIILLIILVISGCSNKKRAAEVAGYQYKEKTETVDQATLRIPGDWVKEDAVCYGLLVSVDKDGNQKAGKPILARVVRISENEIKMKAMETVSLAPVKGCTKMGISKGDTWMEKEGDLFRTKEEAITFLRKKNLYKEQLGVKPSNE
jgi:hypothetical protein